MKHILLLLATLAVHKSALFDCNGIRLVGEPRRHKHYANAPQCYVKRSLPILLSVTVSTTLVIFTPIGSSAFSYGFSNKYDGINVIHFSFNLLRFKGLYMFRPQPQEALHKRHCTTVYCVRTVSIGCGTVATGTVPYQIPFVKLLLRMRK
jgi:hypothetical protein